MIYHPSIQKRLLEVVPMDYSKQNFPLHPRTIETMTTMFQGFIGSANDELEGGSNYHKFIRKDSDSIIKTSQQLNKILKKENVREHERKMICATHKKRHVVLHNTVLFGPDIITATDQDIPFIPHMFDTKEWKAITQEIKGSEYSQSSWPKRRRLILNQIRHNCGTYDLLVGVQEDYAHAIFADYINEYHPLLTTGLDDYLDNKGY